jgi:putative Holliday junction resolvase
VKEEAITRIIVGFPLDMRGTEGEAARRARDIAQAIADATNCDVELFDERLTTVQAQRALTASGVRGKKARSRIDEASAVEILQAWLDARKTRRRKVQANEPGYGAEPHENKNKAESSERSERMRRGLGRSPK